jgi:hypothetical protein
MTTIGHNRQAHERGEFVRLCQCAKYGRVAGGLCSLSESRVRCRAALIVLVKLKVPRRHRTIGIEAFDGDEAPLLISPAKRAGEIAREPLERPAGIGVRCQGMHEDRFQIRAGLEALKFDQGVIHATHAEPARFMHRQQRIERGAAFHHEARSVACCAPRV